MHADYAAYTGVGAQARPPDFEGIRVYEHGLPPNPSVADVGRERGVHPAEAMIDLCVASGGDQLFIQPTLYPQDETVLLRALRHPRTVMTFCDSGAHLSQIADSSIHTHLLGHWVRDRREFTLEEAVRMVTLAPALAWGLSTKGLLRPGMDADLNVFDPDTVGPAVPTLVDDLPAGGRRLEQRSVGFLATVVAGRSPSTAASRPGPPPVGCCGGSRPDSTPMLRSRVPHVTAVELDPGLGAAPHAVAGRPGSPVRGVAPGPRTRGRLRGSGLAGPRAHPRRPCFVTRKPVCGGPVTGTRAVGTGSGGGPGAAAYR